MSRITSERPTDYLTVWESHALTIEEDHDDAVSQTYIVTLSRRSAILSLRRRPEDAHSRALTSDLLPA
ncbi:hypothetical protein [Candidatus Bealeia paramacronuclearis]|uniref:hypothetical protein n=1 Tax=Candidatus Bealeia paramacronuclearis TaxID=1921001 RepID=UPI002F26D32E